MNINLVYEILKNIKMTLIEYDNNSIEKDNKNVNFILKEDSIIYSFGKSSELSLTKEEMDMLVDCLKKYFGFDCNLVNGFYYNLRLKDYNSFLNNSLLNSFENFNAAIEKDNQKFEKQMITIIRDIATLNNKKASQLYITIENNSIMINGDGVMLSLSRFETQQLFNTLKKIGNVVESQKNVKKIVINNPALLWQGTCQEGAYNFDEVLNKIKSSFESENFKGKENVTLNIIIRDFSIHVNGKAYYFEKGLSQSIKDGLAQQFINLYGAKMNMIGKDYTLVVGNSKQFIDDHSYDTVKGKSIGR